MQNPQRVAAVDVGTNTVLLVVAEGSPEAPVALVERADITRLGQGVDATRRLDDRALARTLECLKDYGDVIRRYGVHRVAGVCTSAARDAENGAAFLTCANQALGFPLQIVDGRREAELTFRGAISGLAVRGRVVVFDVGGGSTEIVIGNAEAPMLIEEAVSLDIGSVRLTERHVRTDPVSSDELRTMREAIRNTLAAGPRCSGIDTGIGVAGTVTTLCAVSQRLASYDAGKVHGHRITRERVEQVTAELAALPLAERRNIPGLDPRRADVIVAGACIVAELVASASLGELTVSDRGVRWGLVHELMALPLQTPGPAS